MFETPRKNRIPCINYIDCNLKNVGIYLIIHGTYIICEINNFEQVLLLGKFHLFTHTSKLKSIICNWDWKSWLYRQCPCFILMGSICLHYKYLWMALNFIQEIWLFLQIWPRGCSNDTATKLGGFCRRIHVAYEVGPSKKIHIATEWP